MGRLWLASSVALLGAAAVGCSDGNSTSVGTDAGADGGGDDELDSGEPEPTDGGADAGTSPACEPLVNDDGEECPCVPLTTRNTFAEPCWVPETGVCGVKSSQLPGGDPSQGDQCVTRDAVGTLSTYCGEFFDQIDALMRNEDGSIMYDDNDLPMYETAYNKGADRALTFIVGEPPAQITLRFEGCCLPSGECGAMLSIPRALDAREPNAEGSRYFNDFNGDRFDLHLGCTSVTELVARLAGTSVGESLPTDKLQNLPYCEYSETGDPGRIQEGLIPGAPKFVCGCGEGSTTREDGFPCLPNLNPTVCGADDATDEQRALIPQFVCGALNSDPRLPDSLKLPNVDVSVCGLLEVTEENAGIVMAEIPEFLCGAEGEPRPGSESLPKLPNLDSGFCGRAEITSSEDPRLAGFPNFLCGCIDSLATELGCLPNIPSAVCGGDVVDADSAILDQVPVFLRGCGARADSGVGPVCMSNVPDTVYGKMAVEVDDKDTEVTSDDCLVGVAEYAHGCGAEVATAPTNDPNCLVRTPVLFGCDDVDGTQERLPEFLCGCGEGANLPGNSLSGPGPVGVGGNLLSCLPNVDPIFCGGVNMRSGEELNQYTGGRIPNSVCGCGEGVAGSNLGVGVKPPGLPCLPNVADTFCGPVAVCTGLNTQGTCAAGQTCRDTLSPGDGIGDYCQPPS